MKLTLTLLVMIAMTSGSVGVAVAGPGLPPDPADAPAKTNTALTAVGTKQARTESYGLLIAAADAVALGGGGFLSHLASKSDSVHENLGPAIMASGYLLAGPIIHLAYGSRKRAIGSFALRVVLPIVGLIVTANNSCSGGADPHGGCTGGGGGFFVGLGLAAVIDGFVLAQRDAPRAKARKPAAFRYRGVAANPNVRAVRGGGFTAGMNGSF